jgi:hypothetical protein
VAPEAAGAVVMFSTGVIADVLFSAGVTADVLFSAGVTADVLFSAGVTADVLFSAGVTADVLFSAGAGVVLFSAGLLAHPAAKTTAATTRSITIAFNILLITFTSKFLFLFYTHPYKILIFDMELLFMNNQ